MKKTWTYIVIALLVSACNTNFGPIGSIPSAPNSSSVPAPTASTVKSSVGVLGANDEEPVGQLNGQVVLAHQESASVTVLNLAE